MRLGMAVVKMPGTSVEALGRFCGSEWRGSNPAGRNAVAECSSERQQPRLFPAN
jgi:hypothetical protein